MANNVRPIPEGYHALTPSLACRNAAKAIEYYKKVFGATEKMRMDGPGGKVIHAELQFGDSVLFVNDEFPGLSEGPKEGQLPSSSVFLYAQDVDATFARALAEGGTSVMPPENMFWGDRYGTVRDPFGHQWGIATHVEDVSPEEMQKRSEAFAASMAARATKAAGQG